VASGLPNPPHGDDVQRAIATLQKLPAAELQRLGFDLQRRDYYSALNDLEFLAANRDLWQGRPLPAGVRFDVDEQWALVQELAAYVSELESVPYDQPPGEPLAYCWNNDFWRGLDALVHYGMIRRLRPSRVVEIGCGWSSLLMARALARNDADGAPAAVHQIEPYPREALMAVLPGSWTLQRSMLQRSSPAAIEQLTSGDILFYDGSHVARAGSDVNWFFFEVLPRVAPGVIVHVHDIFWPSDYPEEWIFERGQTWNEQYILQAFLMYNEHFELLLANAAVVASYGADVARLFASLPEQFSGGCSAWIRRRDAPAEP
jgi:hypothetical protein